MSIDTFWGNIFSQDNVQNTISILKNIPLFSNINLSDLIKLSKFLHSRKYSQNEIVFLEKEPGAGLYIVKSGSVKIFIKSLDGQERILAKLEKGCFFGEVALIDESPRSASVIALEETELLGFFRPDLMTLMDRDPRLSSQILLHLATVLGQRLRETNKEIKRKQND